VTRFFALLVVATVVAVVPADARACDEVPSVPHTVDPSMQATDTTPPTLPAIPPLEVYFAPTSPQGCDCGNCGENSYFGFSAVARDDVTHRFRIGYRISLESGTLPRGVALPATAIDPNFDIVQVGFNSETVTSLSNFTLRVVAIDLAGNESAPQIVVMQHSSGSDECAVASARGARSRLGWIAFGALIVTAYRRRRR
jgi:hypothetical protein